MKPEYHIGARLPDLALPDHRGRATRLSSFTAATLHDEVMGHTDGYPLIVVFYRGFYCPRDGAQMRQLVRFQEELSVNYCRLVAISADEPLVCAAYRYGLGASFPFLSDSKREAIDLLGIRDETEEEYPGCALPTTFVTAPDLTIHKIYNGWYFVGRPTLEELRMDLRELMSRRSNYSYEAYNTEALKSSVRIPAEYWEVERPLGAPATPGGRGNPVARGTVEWFSLNEGDGMIRAEDGRAIYLSFTGIPGEGYRTVQPGSEVEFEIVTGPVGHLCAINVRVLRQGHSRNAASLTSTIVSGMNN
jgi:cold shock CspA family protein/peroxiredoxin